MTEKRSGGGSRMTLRVSRDSGRTWEPLREVRDRWWERSADGSGGPGDWLSPSRYPSCACPRCTATDTNGT